MRGEVEEWTRQANLEERGDGTPGSVNWQAAAKRFYGTDGTPRPRRVLGYIRRCHRMVVPLYGAICAYHRAQTGPEVDPSLATCEQLPRTGAVGDFSEGSLSQGRADVADRVRVDALGLDDRQRFGLDMAFACGVDDVDRAMDLATRSLDSPSVMSAALECGSRRREKILALLEADEFGQARALATCGEMSVQLGCPTHAGGCGCEDNYVPISCDSRLCPDCMASRIGRLVEQYTPLVEDWDNPVFGTFTIENVTAATPEELERRVDAIKGAFGRLRRRTIPATGTVSRETEDGDRKTKRWVWSDDRGEPATDYWRQDLVRRGHRGRADRLEQDYVDDGRNLPFGELVDAGLYAVDIKQVGADEFNVHLHTLWDGAYIPQPALSSVWEDLTGDPVVDVRRVYDRGGGSAKSAVMEVVAYACKPPEFDSVDDEVAYLQALKGSRMVQPFGDLHGSVPDVEPSLLCSECGVMPAWWDYLGTVSERIDNMGSVHDGESTGNDPPMTGDSLEAPTEP